MPEKTLQMIRSEITLFSSYTKNSYLATVMAALFNPLRDSSVPKNTVFSLAQDSFRMLLQGKTVKAQELLNKALRLRRQDGTLESTVLAHLDEVQSIVTESVPELNEVRARYGLPQLVYSPSPIKI